MTDRNRYSSEPSTAWWEREERDRESDRPNERGSFAREPEWRDRPRDAGDDWRSGWRAGDDPYATYGEQRFSSRDDASHRAARDGEFGRDYGPAAPYRQDIRRGQARAHDRSHGASYRSEAGYDQPRGGPGRAAYGYGDDRNWWDHAKDRVAGTFGDEDAQRRADWDNYQSDARRDGEHRGRGPKGYSRSDDRVREDVSDRLSDDSWLDATSIEVAAQKGEVTLSGTVINRSDKRRAEDLADGVSGVNHVQNNLRVAQTYGSTNEAETTRTTATGSTTGKVS